MKVNAVAYVTVVLSFCLGAAVAADLPEAPDRAEQDSDVVIVCSELLGQDSPSACVENLRDRPDPS